MCKAQNFEGFAALTGTITRTFAELSASINSKEVCAVLAACGLPCPQ